MRTRIVLVSLPLCLPLSLTSGSMAKRVPHLFPYEVEWTGFHNKLLSRCFRDGLLVKRGETAIWKRVTGCLIKSLYSSSPPLSTLGIFAIYVDFTLTIIGGGLLALRRGLRSMSKLTSFPSRLSSHTQQSWRTATSLERSCSRFVCSGYE